MRSTLDELRTTLDGLEDFVKSIEPVNSWLADPRSGISARHLTVRKRLDYAAFMIALYAAFEKFAEELVWATAELLSRKADYSDLPEKLRVKHLQRSGELLARGRLGEGRYAEQQDVDLVSNLHLCLSGQQPYHLNRYAIVHHEGNLRADVVQELFGAIGVEKINDSARQSEPLSRWYCRAHNLDMPPEKGVPQTSIDFRIKDLVDRRNQIAHNGGDLSESLGAAEMQELLEFVRAYCQSLYDVVACAYLSRCYIEEPGAAEDLGRFLQGPLKEGFVVVVGRPLCRVYVGQPVLGTRNGRVTCWGRIKGILIADQAVQSVEPDSTAEDLGLRVDFKIAKNARLHLLPRVDHAIWE